MAFKNYREESKKAWGTDDGIMDIERIQTGAILRIADATEKMAGNIIALEIDRNYYKGNYERAVDQRDAYVRQISALKGVITKLKNRKP